MSKLKNIKAIGEMLENRHWTQTRQSFGFADSKSTADKNKKREVGERWEEYDEDGNVVCIWEQCEGYRRRMGKHAEIMRRVREDLNTYSNCIRTTEYCKSQQKNRLDKRFRNKFGRCAECQTKIESQLKAEGKYAEYEREQMIKNAEAFFKNADKEIDIVCKELEGNIDYANADGSMDRWKADLGMSKQIRSEYEQYKQIALNKLYGLDEEE